MTYNRFLIATAVAASLTACAAQPPVVLTPTGPLPQVQWTAQQREMDLAIQPVRKTEQAAYLVARLRGSEKPHVHDKSDLTVIILTGKVRMHVAEQVMVLGPGDVIDIPRGVVHWGENLVPAPGASEAYLISVPPLDPKDARPVQK